MLIFFTENLNLYMLYYILAPKHHRLFEIHFQRKQKRPHFTVILMAADALVKQGTKASAAMILT